jgi:predicted Zn-dependent protease
VSAGVDILIERANARSPRFVLPFRAEVVEALELATRRSDAWKPRYYLALGYWGAGRVAEAALLLTGLRSSPDFAPAYALRASLPGRALADQVADLERAAALDSMEWRIGKLLTERYLEASDTTRAVQVASRYAARFPQSYILGMTRVRALMAAQRYAEADAVLEKLTIIPYEGSAEGHALYREAKLMLAIDAMRAAKWDDARRLIAAAREWPERLGAGKPYDADLDERLENWLAADLARRVGAPEAAAMSQTHPMPEATGLTGRVIARWRTLDR